MKHNFLGIHEKRYFKKRNKGRMLYPDGLNHTVKICLQQVEIASLFKWWCQVSSAKKLQMQAVAGQEASEKRVSTVFLPVTH